MCFHFWRHIMHLKFPPERSTYFQNSFDSDQFRFLIFRFAEAKLVAFRIISTSMMPTICFLRHRPHSILVCSPAFSLCGRVDPFSAVIWTRANLRCVSSVLRGWCVTFAPGRSVPSGYSTWLHARWKYGLRNLPPHECTISHQTAAIIGPLNNVLLLLGGKSRRWSRRCG